jgi:hypothetical protein
MRLSTVAPKCSSWLRRKPHLSKLVRRKRLPVAGKHGHGLVQPGALEERPVAEPAQSHPPPRQPRLQHVVRRVGSSPARALAPYTPAAPQYRAEKK